MSDALSRLTEQEAADLCALADGTLPAERRPEVEAWVAASDELQELLRRQRAAVAAVRTLDEDVPPASLRAAVVSRRRGPSARWTWRVASVGALAAAAVVAAILVLAGGPGGPTVAEAAALAERPAALPAPERLEGDRPELALDVEGVRFPDFARSRGWRAVGARHDRIDGRRATVVYYAKAGQTIAYVIVSGSALPPPSTEATIYRGIDFRSLRVGEKLAVTWQRAGHTCVLVGPVPRDELLALASYGSVSG